MAFISSGYDPKEPMKNRITDIGPRNFKEFYPPVIAKNKGKWLYHEILKPGVLVHVAESGDKIYTVRVGGARLMSDPADPRDLPRSPTSTAAAMCAGPPATTSSSWSTTRRRSSP